MGSCCLVFCVEVLKNATHFGWSWKNSSLIKYVWKHQKVSSHVKKTWDLWVIWHSFYLQIDFTLVWLRFECFLKATALAVPVFLSRTLWLCGGWYEAYDCLNNVFTGTHTGTMCKLSSILCFQCNIKSAGEAKWNALGWAHIRPTLEAWTMSMVPNWLKLHLNLW